MIENHSHLWSEITLTYDRKSLSFMIGNRSRLWSEITLIQKDMPLWKGVENGSHFFLFVENFSQKPTRFRTFASKTHKNACFFSKDREKEG